MAVEHNLSAFLEKREKRRLLAQVQAQAEQKGLIPPPPSLLLRTAAWSFQYTGGALLGVFLGIAALLVNFVLFVLLLHIKV